MFWKLPGGKTCTFEGCTLLLCTKRLKNPLNFSKWFLLLVLNDVNEGKITVAVVDSQN